MNTYMTKWADLGEKSHAGEFKESHYILQHVALAAESLRLAADDLYEAATRGRLQLPAMYERLGMTSLLIHQLWQQCEQMGQDTASALAGVDDRGETGDESEQA